MLNLLIFAVLLPLNLLAAESKVYYEARPIQKIDDSFQSFRHGRAKVLLFEKDGQILAGNIGDIPTKFKHIGGVDGKLTYLHKAKSQWNETWHTQIVLDKNRQSFEYKGWCDADWCEKNPQVQTFKLGKFAECVDSGGRNFCKGQFLTSRSKNFAPAGWRVGHPYYKSMKIEHLILDSQSGALVSIVSQGTTQFTADPWNTFRPEILQYTELQTDELCKNNLCVGDTFNHQFHHPNCFTAGNFCGVKGTIVALLPGKVIMSEATAEGGFLGTVRSYDFFAVDTQDFTHR